MKDFLRQNGILLVIIALLLTILIGVGTAFMGGNADPLSNVVNTVTSPIRNGIAAAADWAEGVYNYVFRYGQIQEELDSLRAQVAELEDQVREGQEAAKQNERLRELLDLQAKREDFVFESARVTGRSTDNWASTLTISKGTSAGVEAGDCVVTSTGVLVGVVSKVGLNWSTVSTIINTDIEIGGIVTRTYSAGAGGRLCPDGPGPSEAELPPPQRSVGVWGRGAHLRQGGRVSFRAGGGSGGGRLYRPFWDDPLCRGGP